MNDLLVYWLDRITILYVVLICETSSFGILFFITWLSFLFYFLANFFIVLSFFFLFFFLLFSLVVQLLFYLSFCFTFLR